MAITEKIVTKHGVKPYKETTATGKDVAALAGMMKEAQDATNERNEVQNNHFGMVELEKPNGQKDIFRQDKASRMYRKGYASTKKTFVVPEMPWLKNKE